MRGMDDDRARVQRMKKLDAKIKEVSGIDIAFCGNPLATW